MTSIAALIIPAMPIAITTSTNSKRNRRRRDRIAGHDAVLGEGGVQEDHVRHDGRAEDADRQQDALGAVESGA